MHEATSRWDVCGSVGCFILVVFKNYVYHWLHTFRIAISWGMYGKGKGIVTWMHHLNLLHVTPEPHSKAMRWAVKTLTKYVKIIKSTVPLPLRPLRLSLTSVPHHPGSRWSRRNVLWCDVKGCCKERGWMKGTDRTSNLKRGRSFYWSYLNILYTSVYMQSNSVQDARHRKLCRQCWQWLKQYSCLAFVTFAYVLIFRRSLGTIIPNHNQCY